MARTEESKAADKRRVQRIVNNRFGGPTNLARLLKKRYPGEGVSTKAVNMWVWRATIPGPWFLRLQEIAAQQGRPLLDEWEPAPVAEVADDNDDWMD